MFDIFEMLPCDFDNTYASFERRVHPDDLPALKRAVFISLSVRKDLHIQLRIVSQKGNVKYLDIHAKLSVDPKFGIPCRFTGVFIDMTRTVLAERERCDFALRTALMSPA